MANKYANLYGHNKIKDDYSKINDGFAAVQADVEALQSKETALESNLQSHKDSIAAHNSDSIDFTPGTSGIAATKAGAAIRELKARVEQIITTPVSGAAATQEVVDARQSSKKGVTYASVDARLEAIETDVEDTKNPTYSSKTEYTAPVISLPSTVTKGLLSASVLGNTVNNILGIDGDCEDPSKWLVANASSYTTNSMDKLFGTKCIEATAIGSGEYGIYKNTNLDISKYYFLTGYAKILNDQTQLNIKFVKSDYSILKHSIKNGVTAGIWERLGVKISPAEFVGVTSQRIIFTSSGNLSSGDKTLFDGMMLFEITSDEYNNLTEQQLMAKYPYINGTKSTLSTRVTTIGTDNLYNKNKKIPEVWVNSSGLLSKEAGGKEFSIKFYVIPGKQYTLKCLSGHLFDRYVIRWEDSKGNFLSMGYGTLSNGNSIIITPVAPANAAIIYIYVNSTGLPSDAQLMVVEGTTAPTVYKECQYSELYLPNNISLSSVGSIKDEVNASTGEYIKRVSDKVTLNGNLSWGGLDTSGTNTYRISIPHGLTNVVSGISNSYIATSSDGSYDADSSIALDKRLFAIGSTTYYIRVEKSKVDAQTGADTLAKFKVYLNAYPITLTYQLATPVITYLPTKLLMAEPNGTIIVEPVVTDVGWYQGKVSIENTSLPIRTIDFVNRIDVNTGSFIPIDLSKVTIAGDGLSFTINGAANGEYYEYAYFYGNELTTLPTLAISYATNLKAQVDSNTNMIGQLSEKVGDIIARLDAPKDIVIMTLKDGVTAPAGNISGMAQIYIDAADGDLKIRFADGTVRTIVVDS